MTVGKYILASLAVSGVLLGLAWLALIIVGGKRPDQAGVILYQRLVPGAAPEPA